MEDYKIIIILALALFAAIAIIMVAWWFVWKLIVFILKSIYKQYEKSKKLY